MRLAATLSVLLLLAGQPAIAQQVRFTGQTTADPTLIRDALNQLVRHAAAAQACTTLTAVESSVLPPGYDPGPRYRPAGGSVTYERWDAVLCDRPVSYLVGFWAAPQGGTMFQVSHPFPEAAPAPPR